jgi:hypothetical protein
MTQPRFAQVSFSDTPWYRSVSRCVRRALFAVMSNHFHVVVRIDAARADSWSTDPEESDFTSVQQRLGRPPRSRRPGPSVSWPICEGFGRGSGCFPRPLDSAPDGASPGSAAGEQAALAPLPVGSTMGR